jgi:hypothetical protein
MHWGISISRRGWDPTDGVRVALPVENTRNNAQAVSTGFMKVSKSDFGAIHEDL